MFNDKIGQIVKHLHSILEALLHPYSFALVIFDNKGSVQVVSTETNHRINEALKQVVR